MQDRMIHLPRRLTRRTLLTMAAATALYPFTAQAQTLEAEPITETPINVRTLANGRIGTGFIPTEWGAVNLSFPLGAEVLHTGSARILTDPARIPEPGSREIATLVHPDDFRLTIAVGGRGVYDNDPHWDSLFDIAAAFQRYDDPTDWRTLGSSQRFRSPDYMTTHQTVPLEVKFAWRNMRLVPGTFSYRSLDFDRFEDLVSS